MSALIVFNDTTVCIRNMCVSVWTTHRASMCTQQVSFPDSPVRRWFLFWAASPQWHQLPPTHQRSPWHRTKTFLAQGGEGGGGHHAWHIYRRGLRSPSPLTPHCLLLFLHWCLYSRLLCLPDHQRASQTAMAAAPRPRACSLYLPQPLSSSACFSTNGNCSPLSLCEIFLSQPSILDFHPPSPFFSASLLVKWSHDSKGKMPSGEVTTHWALSYSLPRWTEGQCVCMCVWERVKQRRRNRWTEWQVEGGGRETHKLYQSLHNEQSSSWKYLAEKHHNPLIWGNIVGHLVLRWYTGHLSFTLSQL